MRNYITNEYTGKIQCKIFLAITLFFTFFFLFAYQTKESEFEKAYTKFERNPFLENKNASSDLAFNKELFDTVTNFGIVIVPNVIEKLRHDSSSGVAISVLSKLTKTNFEFTKDEKTRTYHYIDYQREYCFLPEYQVKNVNTENIFVYWWDHGRQLTPQLFAKKYADYQAAKKSGNEKDIKAKYTRLQNMGVIILPDLLAKIEAGETDLIPMFSELGDQKDLKTAAVCRAWWDANKKRYEVILDYKKDSKEKK